VILELIAASIQLERFLSLIYFAVGSVVFLISGNFGWKLLRQIAFDLVAIYAAVMTARCDEERRRLDLEICEQGLIMLESGRGE